MSRQHQRVKLTDHFWLDEFVPRVIWEAWGARSILFLDRKTVEGAQWIRDRYGRAMTINNWWHGGALQHRGFRPRQVAVGGDLSQHRLAKAIDFNVAGMSPQEIADDVMKHQAEFIAAGWTRMENPTATPTWTHLDQGWHNMNGIWVVNP